MISNGLRGKKDPEAYVRQCDTALKEWAKLTNLQYELIHNFHPGKYEREIAEHGVTKARIRMLGKTIVEELAIADILALCDDWYNYDGCVVEFEVAKHYNKPIIFLQTAGFNPIPDEKIKS